MSQDLTQPMNFDDLEEIEIPVSIKGKKYVLREATEAGARAYRNASIAGARMEEGSLAAVPEDLGGVQSILLSHCMFHTDGSGVATSQAVKRETILDWRSRITKPLFKRAQQISELEEEEDTVEKLEEQLTDIQKRLTKLKEDSAKNVSSSTTTGSGSLATTE